MELETNGRRIQNEVVLKGSVTRMVGSMERALRGGEGGGWVCVCVRACVRAWVGWGHLSAWFAFAVGGDGWGEEDGRVRGEEDGEGGKGKAGGREGLRRGERGGALRWVFSRTQRCQDLESLIREVWSIGLVNFACLPLCQEQKNTL